MRIRGYLRPKTLRYVSEPRPPEDLDSATRESWPGPVTLRLESMSMFVWAHSFVVGERIYILIFAPQMDSLKAANSSQGNDLMTHGFEKKVTMTEDVWPRYSPAITSFSFYTASTVLLNQKVGHNYALNVNYSVRPWLSVLHHCSPFLILVFFSHYFRGCALTKYSFDTSARAMTLSVQLKIDHRLCCRVYLGRTKQLAASWWEPVPLSCHLSASRFLCQTSTKSNQLSSRVMLKAEFGNFTIVAR